MENWDNPISLGRLGGGVALANPCGMALSLYLTQPLFCARLVGLGGTLHQPSTMVKILSDRRASDAIVSSDALVARGPCGGRLTLREYLPAKRVTPLCCNVC